MLDSLESTVIHSTAPAVSEFTTSNDLFNRIYTLVRWAQLNNVVSVLTDCPHREKLGWLEQTHLNGPALRYNFDLDAFFPKTMNDIADSQHADGMVPTMAPEYTSFSGGFLDSPEWGSAFPLIAWQQYEFTGDKELLRRYYPGMARYASYLASKASGDIVSYGLSDWYDIGPGRPGFIIRTRRSWRKRPDGLGYRTMPANTSGKRRRFAWRLTRNTSMPRPVNMPPPRNAPTRCPW